MWYVVAGIGILTALLMVVYNRIVRPAGHGRKSQPGGQAS
jgi:hypothetical protein